MIIYMEQTINLIGTRKGGKAVEELINSGTITHTEERSYLKLNEEQQI